MLIAKIQVFFTIIFTYFFFADTGNILLKSAIVENLFCVGCKKMFPFHDAQAYLQIAAKGLAVLC